VRSRREVHGRCARLFAELSRITLRERVMSTTKSRRAVAALTAIVCCLYWPIAAAGPGDALQGSNPGVSPAGQSKSAGSEPSVSEQTGAFQYSYPITVPPGRLGMQPALSLAYSSSGPRRGGIAAGWSLNLPEISQDWSRGRFAPAPYVSSLAGGQRLVHIPDTNEYRAQYDTTQTRYFSGGAQPWEARTTSGKVYRFAEADHLGGASGTNSKSQLTSETDAFGNRIDYFWEKRSVGYFGEFTWTLNRIEYTANAAANLPHHAEVVFNWTTAPSCDGGASQVGASVDRHSPNEQKLRQGAAQLNSIVTRVRDSAAGAFRTVRTISLGYDASAMACSHLTAATRLLTSIQETAISRTGVSATLPATTFEYGALWQERPRSLTTNYPMPQNHGEVGLSGGTSALGPSQIREMLLDVDGDGLVDKLTSTTGKTCKINWYRNDGDSFVEEDQIPLPTIPWGGDAPGASQLPEYCSLSLQMSSVATPTFIHCDHKQSKNVYRFMDLDGDALPELVTAIWYDPGTYDPNNPLTCGPDSMYCDPPPGTVCEDDGTGGVPHMIDGKYVVTVHKNLGHGHFDPEGTRQYWPIKLDAAGGNSLARPISTKIYTQQAPSYTFEGFEDIDGDGKLDIVDISGDGSWRFYKGDGTGQFVDRLLWPAPEGTYFDVSETATGGAWTKTYQGLVDVNSDGLPDLLVGNTDTGRLDVYVNTGWGFDFDGGAEISSLTPTFNRVGLATTQGNTLYSIETAERWYGVRLLDVDGDGLLDLASSPDWGSSASAVIYPGTGARWAGTYGSPAPPTENDYSAIFSFANDHDGYWTIKSDAIDLTGDGVSEYVIGSIVKARNTDAAPPAILSQINNGFGGVTRVSYASLHDPTVVTQLDGRTPSHGSVVRAVTRDATVAAPESTTTYRYEKPVYNPGAFGDDWGFRGFTKAATTSPTGRMTETSYDYSIRYDGVPVESRVIDANHNVRTRTMTEYTIVKSDPVILTFATKTSTQTYFDGTGPGRGVESPIVVTTAHYAPHANGAIWLSDWEETEVVAPNPLVPIPAKKRKTTTYEITSDANATLVRPDVTETLAWTEGAWKATGRIDEWWDGTKNYATDVYYMDVREYVWGFGRTERTYRASGQIATVRRPSQTDLKWNYLPSAVRELRYDPFEVLVTREIDELGFFHDQDVDLALGMAYRSYAVHSIPDGGTGQKRWTETSTDGFGRVLTVQRTHYDGTAYVQELVSQNSYVDGPDASMTTSVSRDHGSTVMVSSKTLYDERGRTWKTIGNPSSMTPSVTTYAYDSEGHVTSYTMPKASVDDGSTVQFSLTYDSMGRLTRSSAPGLAAMNVIFDGTIVRQFQDASTDGGEASDKTLYYDVAGALLRVDEKTTNGIATTTYEYDGIGKIAKIADADGVVSTYKHNFNGQRTEIRRGNRIWRYFYDRGGNLMSVANPVPWPQPPGISVSDFVNTYTYDAIDRKTSERAGFGFLNGTSMPGVKETHGTTYFDYDTGCDGAASHAVGQLCRVRSPIGMTTYEYDAEGEVSSEHRDLEVNVGGGDPIAIDERLSMTYNALGAPVDMSHQRTGDGTSLIRTTYDEMGYPHSVGAGYSSVETPSDTITLATLEVSPYTGVARGRHGASSAAPSQTWTYDDIGRIVSNKVSASGTLRAGEGATYYANGNVATLLDHGSGVTFSYEYDPQDQLIGVSTSDPSFYAAAFEYTKNGRVQTAYTGSSNTSADVFPRDVNYYYPWGYEAPHSILDRSSGTPVVELGYDDSAGNITQRKSGGRTLNYWHDAAGEMRGIEEAGTSNREMYVYDHTGNRILAYSTARGNEPARLRHWFGPAETTYTTASIAVKEELTVGLGGQPIARINNGDVAGAQHLFSNVLGHLLAVLDGQGNVRARFTYGPYGEVIQVAGADAASYRRRFNGKELDAFTDLAYYGFRYYDRQLLMWTQPDPLLRTMPDIALDSPRDASLYAFSMNNPMRFVDALGLKPNNNPSQPSPPAEIPTVPDDPDEWDEFCAQNPGLCEDIEIDGTERPYDIVESAYGVIWRQYGHYRHSGRVMGVVLQTPISDETYERLWSNYRMIGGRFANPKGGLDVILGGGNVIKVAAIIPAIITGAGIIATALAPAAGGLAGEITGESVVVNANTLHHIFGRAVQHGLQGVLRGFGGSQMAAFRWIYSATKAEVAAQGLNGIFQVVVEVAGTQVTVRGAVVAGIVRVSTAFVE